MVDKKPLVDPEDALARVLTAARPLSAQSVAVEAAVGRALSVDVFAQRTLPPWDNSAMDGYAVRSRDLASGPARLTVIETVFAGQMPSRPLGPNEATRVMTGAPVPAGSDAVVMQEKTRAVAGDPTRVEILDAPAPGQFVRPCGGDARRGDLLLPAGTLLGIPEAALLWAQGITHVEVPRRPTVALLATGDELTTVSEVSEGRIVDTNTPALALAVAAAGGLPTVLGIARDDRAQVRALFERALTFDVVLSTAGVSVGERDHVRGVLEDLGVRTHFAGVAIKPGKPVVFGTFGDNEGLLFGLPGNPASSLVTFELFVRPALRRLAGLDPSSARPVRVNGRVDTALDKPGGLTHFVRVSSEWRDGELWVTPLHTQLSGAIRSTVQATHLLIFPGEATHLSPGDSAALLPVSCTPATSSFTL